MKKTEYLTELMKKDIQLIAIAEKDVRDMELKLGDELKKAEEKCDSYEEMYEGDDGLIMSAYIEYERIRSPLTELESVLSDFKRSLIDHYEQLLIEKRAYNNEIGMALSNSKINVVKMDETVEIIKGVLI